MALHRRVRNAEGGFDHRIGERPNSQVRSESGIAIGRNDLQPDAEHGLGYFDNAMLAVHQHLRNANQLIAVEALAYQGNPSPRIRLSTCERLDPHALDRKGITVELVKLQRLLRRPACQKPVSRIEPNIRSDGDGSRHSVRWGLARDIYTLVANAQCATTPFPANVRIRCD